MMFYSHLIVAAAGFGVYVKCVTGQSLLEAQSPELWAGLAGVLLGAALPDIDHPESTVGRRVKWLSYPIRMVFGHRGITHSLLAVLGFAWVAFNFNSPFISWLGLGYLLHLLGDYLTNSGIPLFYPSSKRYRFFVTTGTNSLSEPLMVAAVVISSFFIMNL